MEFGFRLAAITDNLIEDKRRRRRSDQLSQLQQWRGAPISGKVATDIRLRLVNENEMRGSKKANIVAMLQTEGVRDDLALPSAANP